MRPCFAVEILTPKKVLLNGLWFGPKKPKRAIVWIHGLGSSMFSKHLLIDRLADRDTAVLAFNNRGHDSIASVPVLRGKSRKVLQGGSAHENFTDSADDIQGAVDFARKRGAKEIYLVGHSTGCQKSVYWASKRGRGVRGLMLLAPISDYAALRIEYKKEKIARALSAARSLIRKGRPHELLPSAAWDSAAIVDAQRFVSLYAGSGPEELFPYWDPARTPRALRSVKLPILVLLAQNDEYADRPARAIAGWFDAHLRGKHGIVIVPNVSHGFRGGEKFVASAMRDFMKS